MVVSADAEQIVSTLLGQFGPAFGLGDLGGLGGALFTRPLGDLNGYVSASTDGLRGKFSSGDRLAREPATLRGCRRSRSAVT